MAESGDVWSCGQNVRKTIKGKTLLKEGLLGDLQNVFHCDLTLGFGFATALACISNHTSINWLPSLQLQIRTPS
jgi:hypothetical protein